MSGSSLDYQYRGIMPRVISSVFQEVQACYDQSITLRVSYLEIYNEIMFDLLSPELSSNITINEDGKGGVFFKGLTQKICTNEEEALSALFEGETNRTIASHRLNSNSSRSHAVFSIYLEMRSRVESTEKVILTKINLVDLAGSERTKKTGSEGMTLVEANYINKSLTFLEQVVIALGEKQRDHVPYRQSKLTNILKDSIGGNSKTVMVANIWPEASNLEETISTLKFATRMTKVSNEATINVHLDPQLLLKKYEREIRDLKQELAMHDTLGNRGRINYEPYTPEQQYLQQQLAKKYLNSEVDDIEIDSLRQVKELFIQFRNVYKNLLKDAKNNNYIEVGSTLDIKGGELKEGKSPKKAGIAVVGAEENKLGFGLGKALKDAKPTSNVENFVRQESFTQDVQVEPIRPQQPRQQPRNEQQLVKKMENIDRNQVFLDFKDKEGKEHNDSVLTNINALKDKKQEIKDISDQCQKTKEEIDRLKTLIERKQETKNQDEIQQGIIDEEEYQYIKNLKELKKKFKVESEKIKELKSTIVLINQNIQLSKGTLLQKFEDHFQKKFLIPLHVSMEDHSVKEAEDVISQSEDVDNDALAYIRAKKKVDYIQKVKKQDRQLKI